MLTRLTIELPIELSRQAKARASLEGVSLSSLIQERLEEFVAGLDRLEEAGDVRTVREIQARLASGEEQLLDWEEVKAELDDLPHSVNASRQK